MAFHAGRAAFNARSRGAFGDSQSLFDDFDSIFGALY